MQALIVGAMLNDSKWLKKIISRYDFVIAVDKGAECFYNSNLIPNELVGDFDSINQDILSYFKSKNLEIKSYNIDKDESDLELAINMVKDYKRIDFTGVLGGKISHEIINLNILSGLKNKDNCVSIREPNVRIEFLSDKNVLKIPAGLRVSIIPTNDNVSYVSLKGFKWNLKKHLLKKASSLTLSNETISDSYVKNYGENIMVVIEPLEKKTRQEKKSL